MLIVAALAALALSACVVAPAPYGRGAAVPVLPVIVELGPDLYFYQHQYHYQYRYDEDRWRYSSSRSGPWTDLPRSHYPREIRFRDSRGVFVAPPLPVIVELGPDLYFVQRGYHYQYRYNDDRWRYSTSRSGPWADLPRSHYPREIRFRDSRGVFVAPPLPVIVELGPDLYFVQRGYHYQYRYNDDRWRYSTSRSGPWTDLPRSHYPKEIRFKDARGVIVAPPLPSIVELGRDSYFQQRGYYYYYQRDDRRWRYSTSRSGPWTDLPRSHYPKEIRFRDGGDRRDRDQDRDRRDRN
ncbi:MAG TPA: hypothetical protein PK725_14800 [Rhodocyclaceae bacterium]|nr:hypothetical protein [Rhodocyclaceae bacterium]HRQ48221.1 hypothetical protein [Rhodocyclaceae bacterium]